MRFCDMEPPKTSPTSSTPTTHPQTSQIRTSSQPCVPSTSVEPHHWNVSPPGHRSSVPCCSSPPLRAGLAPVFSPRDDVCMGEVEVWCVRGRESPWRRPPVAQWRSRVFLLRGIELGPIKVIHFKCVCSGSHQL